MSLTQKRTCCSQCPFARSTPKEYLDTMGQNGERFAGQAIGPFQLPCHMTQEFENWREDPNDQRLCAGAAKYRANIGVADSIPDELGRLECDHEHVFSSAEELLAHHEGISIEEAQAKLKIKPVERMMLEEMSKQETRLISASQEAAADISRDLAKQTDEVITQALNAKLSEAWTVASVRDRLSQHTSPDGSQRMIYLDGNPLLLLLEPEIRVSNVDGALKLTATLRYKVQP